MTWHNEVVELGAVSSKTNISPVLCFNKLQNTGCLWPPTANTCTGTHPPTRTHTFMNNRNKMQELLFFKKHSHIALTPPFVGTHSALCGPCWWETVMQQRASERHQHRVKGSDEQERVRKTKPGRRRAKLLCGGGALTKTQMTSDAPYRCST